MDASDYQKRAIETAIYPKQHEIVYPALGLANEAGEVLGKIKKVLRDSNGVFTGNLKIAIADELGDVMWYAAALAYDLDYDLSAVLQQNLDKLASRVERGVIGGSGDNR